MSSGQPGASSSGGAGSGTGNAGRMSKYKNAGLDTQELRRRRTCSSHVFTNPEFSICNDYFDKSAQLFVIFYDLFFSFINTLYDCKTTNVFILKIKSVPKITIFGLKMMVKNWKWSRKNCFEIPPYRKMVTFFAELVIFLKTLPFYDVKSIRRKFKKYFFYATFHCSF